MGVENLIREFSKELTDGVKRSFIYFAAVVLILFTYNALLLPIGTIAFDSLYGETVVNQTLQNISAQANYKTNPAQAVMDWEQHHFKNPYGENKPADAWTFESITQLFSIVKINGSYQLFVRDATPSWKIQAGLANCGEYSQIFIYLMNKSGIKARAVTVPGEDHAWAEYYNGSKKTVVETSAGYIINNTTQFAQGRNWSYLISQDIFNTSDTIDVSDEYISRGNLSVRVFDDGRPAKDIQVTVLSPFLMHADPSRYKVPIAVLSNSTNVTGVAKFELGPKTYIVQVKKSFLFLNLVFSKNATINIGQDNLVEFDLGKDKGEWKLLG